MLAPPNNLYMKEYTVKSKMKCKKTRWSLKIFTSGCPKYILTITIQSQKKWSLSSKTPDSIYDFSYSGERDERSSVDEPGYRPVHAHWFLILLSVLHCDWMAKVRLEEE
jgi:hypothetical protein